MAIDRDPAGERATGRLGVQAHARCLPFLPLMPALGDFNDDLLALGPDDVRAHVLGQLREVSPALLSGVVGSASAAACGS